jgi:hypothetical protein
LRYRHQPNKTRRKLQNLLGWVRKHVSSARWQLCRYADPKSMEVETAMYELMHALQTTDDLLSTVALTNSQIFPKTPLPRLDLNILKSIILLTLPCVKDQPYLQWY